MKIFANQISTNIRENGVLEIYVKDCLAATVSDGRQDDDFIYDVLEGMGYEINEDVYERRAMTEEEDKEYTNIDNRSYSCPKDYAHIPAQERIDWLNAHHFDFRGLIEKGLALEAPKDMYKKE